MVIILTIIRILIFKFDGVTNFVYNKKLQVQKLFHPLFTSRINFHPPGNIHDSFVLTSRSNSTIQREIFRSSWRIKGFSRTSPSPVFFHVNKLWANDHKTNFKGWNFPNKSGTVDPYGARFISVTSTGHAFKDLCSNRRVLSRGFTVIHE